jgi:glutamate-1-semialdehyde 2,1-aminomutase
MSHKTETSRKLRQRAEQVIPGGVDSPVRAFKSVGGEPVYIARGEGSRMWDVDNNEYIDYVLSWGPLILGHSAPEVLEAIVAAARKGTSFGASSPSEVDLAEAVLEAYPCAEKVRFVNSGTEATMSAIRLARAYTNRKYILKFEGCYHGHSDALLVKAGSGIATLGIPGSAGVPEEFVQFTLALPYNNLNVVDEAFRRYKNEIACVIVEPVVGNMGCVPPHKEFLDGLRYLTSRDGTRPDLVTLGKVIGGGLPVGAYAGPSEIMDMIAPLGPVYQAGTLSGNPLAMAAGLAQLCSLRDNREIYGRMDRLAGSLVTMVQDAAKEAGVAVTANRVGSMFTWFFAQERVTDWDSAAKCDTAAFGRFHRAMLNAGVYLPPSQFEAAFLSAAHTDDDISETVAAAREAFALVGA